MFDLELPLRRNYLAPIERSREDPFFFLFFVPIDEFVNG